MPSTVLLHKSLKDQLPQYRHQLQSTRSGPSKDSSDAPRFGVRRCIILNSGYHIPRRTKRLSPSNDSYATSRSSSSRVVASVSSVKIGRPRKAASETTEDEE